MTMKSTLTLAAICLGIVCVSTNSLGQEKAQKAQNPHVDITFDYNMYPLDPRKPCSNCIRPNDRKAIPRVDLPGLRGRPNMDPQMGGCMCGQKKETKRSMISWNWPQPFSAIREDKRPGFSGWLEDPCRPRVTSVFDKLGDVKLSNYQRKDNGYTGAGRDPYGCLGESRAMEAGVRGLQFRQPGEPVFGSPVYSEPLPGQGRNTPRLNRPQYPQPQYASPQYSPRPSYPNSHQANRYDLYSNQR